MTVARPAARPAVERQRRRGDARRGRRRLRGRVRAADEPARGASSGCATRTSPTRSGSTSPATTRAPATSPSSRLPAPQPVLPPHRRPAARALRRSPTAHVRQPQHARRTVPWVNGVKTGHTPAAGYVLVGSAAEGHDGRDRRARRAERGGARRATERLLEYGLAGFQRIDRGAACARRSHGATVPIKYRRGAELQLGRLRRPAHGRAARRARPRDRPRDRGARRGRRAARRGPQLGTRRGPADGERVAVVPLVASTALPAAGLAERTTSWLAQPIGIILAFAALTGTVLLARWRRRSGGPRRRRQAREEATAA